MKRSGKFYYNNEKQTLRKLGLTPAPGSGSGWIVKEDGENERVMVQLKSTDANSYRLEMLDMKKLEYHANESSKVPVFLVQFLQQDKIYAIVSVENIQELYEAFELGKAPEKIKVEETEVINRRIKSSSKAREQFFEEKERNYERRKRNG